MKGKGIKGIVLFITLILLLGVCAVCCAAPAAGHKKVRVAYFNLGEYFTGENGKVRSYDRDYLSKVEGYSNLAFEYVDCGTWANALAMLNNNEVDLVGTVQWSEEREKDYEFCLENYGFTMTTLVAAGNSPIVYEDYEAIGKSVVGYTKNYVRKPEIDQLFKQHNISPQIKTYENEKSLENALIDGEVDVIAVNSHAALKDWKVIERINYAPFFFISRKGNKALTDEIDAAIAQISIYEKTFLNDLMRRWFPVLVSMPLTKAEIEYINTKDVLTVYFDSDTKPLSWKAANNEMMGRNREVCDIIAQRTGLKFKYGFTQDLKDNQKNSDNVVTNFTIVDEDDFRSRVAEGRTRAVTTDTFSLYHITGKPYKPDAAYTVAIPIRRSGIRRYLETQYPSYKIAEYASPLECFKALNDKKVDLVFLSNNIADTIIVENDYSNCAAIPTTAHEISLGLQFHGDHAAMLADIVNKGLSTIRQKELNEIEIKYALNTAPKATIAYFVSNNLAASAMIVVVLVATLLLIAVTQTRNRAIQKESQRVQAANDSKAEFFARMSHDMRTPMNGILGITELAKNENDVEAIHNDLEKIYYSGKYMLGLINDTLDIQRLEAGKLALEPTIVPSKLLFDDILALVESTMRKKEQHFELSAADEKNDEMSWYVRIDTLRFKQIVTNILSNAIKYTPNGGNISMHLQEVGRDKLISHQLITISDNGVGMSEDFIKNRLFDPYAQEHNALSDQYGGSGLGLSIVKKLVTLMGGRIEVESELGKGTTFRIYLDVEIIPKEEAEKILQSKQSAENASAGVIEGKRVLLCEDHPINAEITKRLLEKIHCTVDWAENGAIGLERFEKSPAGYYNAVLMDIRMPVMDGLKATEMIRASKHPDAKTIPIIAMSANAYQEDVDKSMKAGMNAHLAKPVEPKTLYSVMAEFLKEKQ